MKLRSRSYRVELYRHTRPPPGDSVSRLVRRPALVAVLLLALLGPGADPAQAAAEPDELLVRFRSGVEAAERSETRQVAGAGFVERLPLGGAQLVAVEPGRSVSAVEAALERDPDVLYAEPNAPRTAYRVPTDPAWSTLWGLDNRGQVVAARAGTPDADIDAPEAWDVTLGSPAVTVAIMDSGMELSHPELAPGLWTNAVEAAGRPRADDDRNGYTDDIRGWDFVEDDGMPQDLFGHGTHVAGIIGARIDDGRGVVGVAPLTTLLPIRTLDRYGVGEVDDAIRSYAYAARAGAKVLNASLGGTRGSLTERDALRASGLLVVAASGNGGPDFRGDDLDRYPNFPCAYELENVVCVAATDSQDALAPFSDFGARTVDIAAPGTSVQSTFRSPEWYRFADGSSMAAPHMSGAAALLWAKNPTLTVGSVRAALLAGGDRVPGLAGRVVTGARLNARTALDLVPALPPPPPPPAAAAPPGSLSAASRDVAPRVRLRLGRGLRIGRVLREGLRVRVRCSEACRSSLRLVADARTARALNLGRRPVVLGRRAVLLRRAGVRTVVVVVSRTARRALRRVPRVSLSMRATTVDRTGHRSRTSAVVSLRR
jgi:subtilisin family serine protease